MYIYSVNTDNKNFLNTTKIRDIVNNQNLKKDIELYDKPEDALLDAQKHILELINNGKGAFYSKLFIAILEVKRTDYQAPDKLHSELYKALRYSTAHIPENNFITVGDLDATCHKLCTNINSFINNNQDELCQYEINEKPYEVYEINLDLSISNISKI